MKINAKSPIITYSEKGKAFAYLRLLYATLNKYIMDYKNCRFELLTENDQSICLARIIRKMEVNDIPVQQFFKAELDSWKDFSNHERVRKLCELMAKDIFCCFDKNLEDAEGNFARVDRLYCVNNDGERDYIVCDEEEKVGLFKKAPTPQTVYFRELMDSNKKGMLPKINTHKEN